MRENGDDVTVIIQLLTTDPPKLYWATKRTRQEAEDEVFDVLRALLAMEVKQTVKELKTGWDK